MAPSFSSITARQEYDLYGPALRPPEGVEPNFDHPPNGNLLATTVIFISVALVSIFVFIRLLAKIVHWERLSCVDIMVMLSYLMYIPYIYITHSLSYTGGFFVNQWNVQIINIAPIAYVAFVATNVYIPLVALVKSAILLEWISIFLPLGTRGYFFWISQVVIGIITVWAILALVLTNVSCTPYELNWDPLLPGNCLFDFKNLTLASAIINFALDLVPLILPQRIIWGLNLSMTKKLGVSIIFLVGLVGIAAACIRLVCVVTYRSAHDDTYNFSIVGLTSMAEVTCAILILCFPSTPKAMQTLGLLKTFAPLKTIWSTRSWPSSDGRKRSMANYEQVDESGVPLSPVRTSRIPHTANSSAIT